MAILVLDPVWEDRLKFERGVRDNDEVWDGVLVMAPDANKRRQSLATLLSAIFINVLGSRRAGLVFAGLNVSDRESEWLENYRIPDVAVDLPGNPARDCETFYLGGPDLAVEILSPGDRSRDKHIFYACVGVRELLVIDRAPWALELYRPGGEGMTLVARVVHRDGSSICLETLPLSLSLIDDEDGAPTVAVEHESDGRRWEA